MSIVKGESFSEAVAGTKSPAEIELGYLLDLYAAVGKTMKARGLNRSDVARLMGKKPSQVTRILSGDANITLRTMAELDCALDLNLGIRPKGDRASASFTSDLAQDTDNDLWKETGYLRSTRAMVSARKEVTA
ncbi:helix-turn-helix domain-containing protein [Olsenella phocaeensis]|uniref:helix-turn-helix domain-containing protein n=1 Tax=Olsenella phocaeensis TaxID=1852385 RepID=UPI00093029B8|nr:helix-turn-helix transcriptional regulator [Olsenella phocaeensis]